jgi:hypothetical protein
MKELDDVIGEIIDLVCEDGNVEVIDTENEPISSDTWLAIKAAILAFTQEASA